MIWVQYIHFNITISLEIKKQNLLFFFTSLGNSDDATCRIFQFLHKGDCATGLKGLKCSEKQRAHQL